METVYVEDKTFDKIDFIENLLAEGEYENCRFVNCLFSSADLSEFKFTSCEFMACNLSLAKLNMTAFRDVKFRNCKLLGLHFGDCNEFGLSFYFENCILNDSSFYKVKIKKTIFMNSQLHGVDFTESDLSGCLFDNCDMSNAAFENTIIEKADFRTAHNYSIDPENNRIRKAKFSISGIPGLLDKYDIEID